MDIGDFIAKESPVAALAVVESVEARCRTLVDFPEQGRKRDDIATGLRIMPLDRRVVVAYRVTGDTIEIIDVFYGGRDYEALLTDPSD